MVYFSIILVDYFSIILYNLDKKKYQNNWIELYSKLKKELSITNKSASSNKTLIDKRKKEYQKLEAEGSELIVSTFGCFIGKNNRGIVVKRSGKTIHEAVGTTLRHITVTTRGISISADAILYCTENNISIDFFNNKGKHCASVSSPVPIGKVIWMNQVNMSDDKKIYLASRIIEGKIKNQLNLIRYYHKYHKNEYELKDRYTITSEQLTLLLDKIKKTEFFINSYQEKLIAIEAQAANTYWAYIRQLLDDDNIDFEKRVRQGASDLFNSMLNYGYAILYSRIWQALLAAKLNPSVGILHKPVHNKPTLAFDLIELFRRQVVDRIVISLIQTKQPLAIDNKGLLEEKTKQLLSKNVLERLNRYEKFRKQELRFDEIIKIQARDLAKYINEEKKSFLPYIAKW